VEALPQTRETALDIEIPGMLVRRHGRVQPALRRQFIATLFAIAHVCADEALVGLRRAPVDDPRQQFPRMEMSEFAFP
ncbi:hypothetical protein, partial [Burkholderia sp. SIMBA_052]|uniref:hypothetical protein n=1 Tax=Burkholderia sp. SIMBA_052 TaxID=3085793 RepID=UPI00397CB226